MAQFLGIAVEQRPQFSAPLGTLIIPTDEQLSDPGWKIDWCFQAIEPALITHLGFRLADYRDHGDGLFPTYRISLQGISGTGAPDGTIKQSGQCFGLFAPSNQADGDWIWVAVNSAYSASRGEGLAIVIEYSSGTIDGLHWMAISKSLLNSRGARGGFPYSAITRTSRVVSKDQPIYGYKSATRSYGLPISAFERPTFNSPAQVALRMVMNASWGQTFTVAGARWCGQPAGSSIKSYSLRLYQGTSLLQSVSVDADFRGTADFTTSDRVSEVYFNEETLVDLNFGDEYMLALVPEDAGTNLQVNRMSVMAAADMSALPGGVNFYYANRADATSAWTKDSAKRPAISPIIGDWRLAPPPPGGIHVKIVPRYNDNLFIEHADDQINSGQDITGLAHEVEGFPIGKAIKSYGGFATVEVFQNPDTDFGGQALVFEEGPIEQFKVVPTSDYVEGELHHLVFRLRSSLRSSRYVDVSQYVRVVS